MSGNDLRSILEGYKKRLGYYRASIPMAINWFDAVERELQDKPDLLLVFFEKMAEKNISIDEIFLTYIYSGVDNIGANFEFLDLVLAHVGNRRPVLEDDFYKVPWGYITGPKINFKRILTFKTLMECSFNPLIDGEYFYEVLKKLSHVKIQGLIGNVRAALKYADLDPEARSFWDHVHLNMNSDIKIIKYFLLLLFLQENKVSMPEFYRAFSQSRLNNPEEIILRLKNLKSSKARDLKETEYREIDSYVMV